MPTYEYECTRCGRTFEVFQSISAKPLRRIKTDCRQCKNNAPVKRLIGTGAALLFRGGGFYETDYRSDSYKKAAKAEKEASTGDKDTAKKAKDGKETQDKSSKASGSKGGPKSPKPDGGGSTTKAA
jgi:putative FmdB family regulatory protein